MEGAAVRLECELSADLRHVYLLLAELKEPLLRNGTRFGLRRGGGRAHVAISAGEATLVSCESAAGQTRGTSVVWGQLLKLRVGQHGALQLSSDLKVSVHIPCGTSSIGVAQVVFRATEVNASLAQQRSLQTEIAEIQPEAKHGSQQTRRAHRSVTLVQMLHARQRDLKVPMVWVPLGAEPASSTRTPAVPYTLAV